MNRHGNDFIVCSSCEVPHIENCTTCFGWGFWKDGGVINAHYAHEFFDSKQTFQAELFDKCLECESDIRGINV